MKANMWFPLSGIIESEKYPHARTLRSSFLQKLKDAFNAFQGKDAFSAFQGKDAFNAFQGKDAFNAFQGKDKHLGIFDYLTAGIRIPLEKAFIIAIDKYSSGGSIGYQIVVAIAGILIIPLEVSKYIFAAAATIIFSPVIAIVHCIASLVARKYRESALNLELNSEGKNIKLQDFCKTTDLNSIIISFLSETEELKFYKNEKTASLSLKQDSLNDNQKLGLNSLFKLNVSDVVGKMESHNNNTVSS